MRNMTDIIPGCHESKITKPTLYNWDFQEERNKASFENIHEVAQSFREVYIDFYYYDAQFYASGKTIMQINTFNASQKRIIQINSKTKAFTISILDWE